MQKGWGGGSEREGPSSVTFISNLKRVDNYRNGKNKTQILEFRDENRRTKT